MRISSTIRKAERKDISHIRKAISEEKNMGNSAPPFYFRWILRKGIALVAERERKSIGFLIAEKNDALTYAQLIYLYVHPQYRGKGIGSALMEEFLRLCRKKSVKYIDLHAPSTTAGFYKQFQFMEEGKFVTLYREWR